MKTTNGTGNHDNDENTDSELTASNVTRFPSPKERAEFERLRAANDQPTPKYEPILNVPPTVKALCLLLIIIQCAVQVLQWLEQAGMIGAPDASIVDAIFMHLWFVPANYSGDLPVSMSTILGPVTHMLLHGGWMHLCINVGTLLAFGAGLEKNIGGKKLLVLFVATGIIGAFTHFAFYPHAEQPLIGASGGISGLFGAILMMAQAQGNMGQGYSKLALFAILWVIISGFFGAYGMPGTDAPIAWTTHVGGFIAGLLLYHPVCKLKI